MKKKLFLIFLLTLLFTETQAQTAEDILIGPFHPAVAADINGNMHVIAYGEYSIYDSLGNNILLAKNISNGLDAISPEIEIRNNQVITAWTNRVPTFNSYIRGQLLNINGELIGDNIEFNDQYFDALRDLCWLTDSTYFVLWVGHGPQSIDEGVYAQIGDINGNLIGNNILFSDPDFTGRLYSARVAKYDSDSLLAVTWIEETEDKYYSVKSRIYNENEGVFRDIQLVYEAENYETTITSAMEAYAPYRYTFVISEIIDTSWVIALYKLAVENDSLKITEKVILADNGLVSPYSEVDIAIDETGKGVVVWYKGNIYGIRLDSELKKFGNIFRVNRSTVENNRYFPKVDLRNDKIYAGWAENSTGKACIIDYNDPLLNYNRVIDTISINKTFALPGIDSVLISVSVNQKSGYVLFAEIEDEEGTPIDTVDLFNDGLHGDSLNNDYIFANYYHPLETVEQNYSINLHTALSQTDTLTDERAKVAFFSTKGPLIIDDVEYVPSDTIPKPGDLLRFKIYFKNLGHLSDVNNVVGAISTEDPCVFSIQRALVGYGDILPGEIKTSTKEFAVRISNDCPGNKVVSFAVSISGGDNVYWYDNFTIVIDTLTSVEEKNTLPKEYSLSQNYPNPFNPTTRIKYQLPEANIVVIKLYDILGREIVELVNERQAAGYYEFNFDGSELSSGMYIYKITTGSFTDSKKLLLIK